MKLLRSSIAVCLIFLFMSLVLWFFVSIPSLIQVQSAGIPPLLLLPPMVIIPLGVYLGYLLSKTEDDEDISSDGAGALGVFQNVSPSASQQQAVSATSSGSLWYRIFIIVTLVVSLGPMVFFFYRAFTAHAP